MTKTTLRRLLPLAWAVILLLVQPGFGQTQTRPHDGSKSAPIQLSDITIAYFVQNEAGQFVWETPPGEPNAIPAGAQKLRFTAKVNNREPGSTIKIRATFQEVCPSPDAGKKYLTTLRHLTESDPTGKQTADRADDEVREIQPDGSVSIEISVHCEDCVRASCGRECPDRDHLGEGPHVAMLTVSDQQREQGPRARGRRGASAAAAKPASFRLDIMSVCPREGKRRPSK